MSFMWLSHLVNWFDVGNIQHANSSFEKMTRDPIFSFHGFLSLLMPWVTTWSIFLSLAPWQHFSHHTYGKNVPRRIVGHISFHFPFLPAHFYGLKREYLLHYILFRFLYLGKGFQSTVIILPQFITKYFRIRYPLQLDCSNIQVQKENRRVDM